MPSRLTQFQQQRLFRYDCIFIDVPGQPALPYYPEGFPRVVTLCGSTRFKEDFESEQARLTDEGCIVLSVGWFGHRDGLDMGGDLKKRLDELHKRKIDLADEVRVINQKLCKCKVCGKWGKQFVLSCSCTPPHEVTSDQVAHLPYVGDSTKSEIEYALQTGKKVTYLNPTTE